MRIVYTCCPKSRFASCGNLIPHNCALNANKATATPACRAVERARAKHNFKLSSSCVINEAHFRENVSTRSVLKFKLSLINATAARSLARARSFARSLARSRALCTRSLRFAFCDASRNEFGEFDAYSVCIGNMRQVPIDTDL